MWLNDLFSLHGMVTLSNIQESWTNSSRTSHTTSTEGLCYFSGSITELLICSRLIPFIKPSFYRCIYLKISSIKVDKEPFVAIPVSMHITDICLWLFILLSVKCTHISGIHDPRFPAYGSWWRHPPVQHKPPAGAKLTGRQLRHGTPHWFMPPPATFWCFSW